MNQIFHVECLNFRSGYNHYMLKRRVRQTRRDDQFFEPRLIYYNVLLY